jgi:DNA-binding MarR family transcriptional regulator
VKRLEALGLVDREADPRDARAWMIGLNSAGEEQLAAIRDSLGTSIEPYLARLSRKDLKTLREGVEVMQRLMALSRPADHG